jgi:hypothetical protein
MIISAVVGFNDFLIIPAPLKLTPLAVVTGAKTAVLFVQSF